MYPYIPNSVPEIKEQMLQEVGALSTEDFFREVPENLRIKGEMNLPEPLLSEYALKRHLEGILAQKQDCHGISQLPGRRLLAAPRAGSL